jgi:prepilin-type N-terminal cleavage/methylation domain-containing protein/prepilin-type processing-associated H-X9-DG protein
MIATDRALEPCRSRLLNSRQPASGPRRKNVQIRMASSENFTLVEPPEVSRRKAAGFTLVELLVVIGIIALLIAILLPALNKAREQSVLVQCMSNLRQCGAAIMNYATDSSGAIVPTVVWGQNSNPPAIANNANAAGWMDDEWAVLLVSRGYIPNQQIANPLSTVAATSILVCPAVRDTLIGTNITGLPAASSNDGFDRRVSLHLQPGLLVDFGYGINGSVYTGTLQNPTGGTDPVNGSGQTPATLPLNIVSQAISTNAAAEPFPANYHMAHFKNSALVVILYDGSEWNGFTTREYRISGARHGHIPCNPSNVNGIDITGQTNLLFLDGHVETVARSHLPFLDYQWDNNRSYMVNNTPGNPNNPNPAQVYPYIWNVTQEP